MKENVAFSGKLYFEGISKTQLDQLIWILNCSCENLGLKLGSGKPLGLGSISCNVTSIKERKIEIEDGVLNYSEIPVAAAVTYEDAKFSSHVKAEFYKIACFDSVPENMEVTYPKDIAQKNHQLQKGSAGLEKTIPQCLERNGLLEEQILILREFCLAS